MKKSETKHRTVAELSEDDRARLERARTLGLDELGWVHGAGCCPANGCCVWEKHIN